MFEGQIVEMDLYLLQHDPEILGDGADEFKLQRWGKGRPVWEVKWQYESLLGGRRMCPRGIRY